MMMNIPLRSIRRLIRPLFFMITVISLVSIWQTFSAISQPKDSIPFHIVQPKVDVDNHRVDFRDNGNSTLSRDEDDDWHLDEAKVDLPFLLNKNKGPKPKYRLPNCARFPDLYTVKFNNIHWQNQETQNESYFLYQAYLDLRWSKSGLDNSGVRVLGMSDGRLLDKRNSSLKFCQLWFSNKSQPVFAPVMEVTYLWNGKWDQGHYFPYLITCQLPLSLKQTPTSVSLVSSLCENATNNLNIMHKERVTPASASGRVPPKGSIGVCVKALDFPGRSMLPRLVEWIEMLRLLGASKILFYEFYVDPAIKKVLDYYEHQGFVVVTPTTLPGVLPNQPQLRHWYIRGKKNNKRLAEVIPYNDCLYRNMYDFEYIAVVDTDEVIMPKKEQNWTQLLTSLNQQIGPAKLAQGPVSTYCFRNFYYIDDMLTSHENVSNIADIPQSFHMLRHVYRTSNSTGNSYMKCFHSTQHTLGVHNHFALRCAYEKCKRHYADVGHAQMNHYRETCSGDLSRKTCLQLIKDAVKDTTILRYKNALMSRVNAVSLQIS